MKRVTITPRKKRVRKKTPRKPKSTKIYTFKCNNSSILKELLGNYGFKEEVTDKCVDFSAWDTYKAPNCSSCIQFIDRNIMNIADNKKSMYIKLKELNKLQYTPKTFTNWNKINDTMLDKSKLYFLKYIHGSGSNDVFVVKSMKDIDKIIKDSNKYELDNCILQEEVPNMLLYNGYKIESRLYVLVCNKNVYLYNDGFIYIYNNKYNKDNIDKSIHINPWVNYEFYSKMPFYNNTISAVVKLCKECITPFILNSNINHYKILGIDIIWDKDYKPYLIEINCNPNLGKIGLVQVKYNMLDDFIKFYILSKLNIRKSINKNWIPCF